MKKLTDKINYLSKIANDFEDLDFEDESFQQFSVHCNNFFEEFESSKPPLDIFIKHLLTQTDMRTVSFYTQCLNSFLPSAQNVLFDKRDPFGLFVHEQTADLRKKDVIFFNKLIDFLSKKNVSHTSVAYNVLLGSMILYSGIGNKMTFRKEMITFSETCSSLPLSLDVEYDDDIYFDVDEASERFFQISFVFFGHSLTHNLIKACNHHINNESTFDLNVFWAAHKNLLVLCNDDSNGAILDHIMELMLQYKLINKQQFHYQLYTHQDFDITLACDSEDEFEDVLDYLEDYEDAA